MSEDRRCGTCKWAEPTGVSDLTVFCVFKPVVPDSCGLDDVGCMRVNMGKKCPCWAPAPPKPAHEEDGA